MAAAWALAKFRFPGKSGQLGASDARFVTGANPLGLDPDDPRGLDNVVIVGPEVHLPLNRPDRKPAMKLSPAPQVSTTGTGIEPAMTTVFASA